MHLHLGTMIQIFWTTKTRGWHKNWTCSSRESMPWHESVRRQNHTWPRTSPHMQSTFSTVRCIAYHIHTIITTWNPNFCERKSKRKKSAPLGAYHIGLNIP
jgi:hypothetical protein